MIRNLQARAGRAPAWRSERRPATAAVAVIIALIVLQLVVAGVVVGGARDQDLTTSRIDAVRAFYAAEAGINMGIREMMLNTDEDGDGKVGGISDNGNSTNDPALGAARFVVSQSVNAGVTTIASEGRSGEARRRAEAQLQ